MTPIVSFIVHDHATQFALASGLAREGYSIRCFPEVAPFLGSLEAEAVGCVVVDLEPPCARVGTLPQLHAVVERLPAIVLSSPGNVALAVQAMKDGADDVLQKPIDLAALRDTVRDAVEKSRRRAERAARAQELRERYGMLSPREIEVVDAVLSGDGNKEVATRLGISARTVETHRSNAMVKLGARTLADLVRMWLDIEGVLVR